MTKALLFFPAAGNGYGTNLNGAGAYGICWSSTGNTGDAYDLYFNSSSVIPDNDNDRYGGGSVRPVSD